MKINQKRRLNINKNIIIAFIDLDNLTRKTWNHSLRFIAKQKTNMEVLHYKYTEINKSEKDAKLRRL